VGNPFERSARAVRVNDNVPQRTGHVRCRPVANSKGYTYWPMILTIDLERERKLLVTKLVLQFRKRRK
jgi:hypothetical protein